MREWIRIVRFELVGMCMVWRVILSEFVGLLMIRGQTPWSA